MALTLVIACRHRAGHRVSYIIGVDARHKAGHDGAILRLRASAPRTPLASSATRSVTALTVRAGRLAFLVETLRDRIDQRRADHHRLGAGGDRRAPASAVRTPKPTATGSLVWRLMRATAACDLADVGRGRAGDAGDRDVIDKARGVREHRRQPLVVGGRRGEPDEVQPGLQRRQAKLLVLLGRQIDHDQAVDAGGLGIGEELRRRRRCRSDCSSPSARSAWRRRPCGTRAPSRAS